MGGRAIRQLTFAMTQPKQTYLEPTQESRRVFFSQGIKGPISMLNLLRFRAVADYAATPELAPSGPISGAEAYQLYIDHTLPYLRESGGEITFFGTGGQYLIEPSEERWDAVMIVRQSSAEAFLAFATNADYLSGMGHRVAALEDSRLLPMVEGGGVGLLS